MLTEVETYKSVIVDTLLMATSACLRCQANEPVAEEFHEAKQLVRRSRPSQCLREKVRCRVMT